MSLNTQWVTVANTATQIDSTVGEAAQHVVLKAPASNTLSVFVGGSAVAVTDGLELEPGAALSLKYDAAASGIYGIVASGTETIQLLEVEAVRG